MITIKNGSMKLNFDGTATVIPIKIKHQRAEYLSGKSCEVFQGKKYKATVNISKLNKAEYELLEDIFFSTSETEVRLPDGRYFIMLFVDSELNMTEDSDEDNNIFYYGSLNLEE